MRWRLPGGEYASIEYVSLPVAAGRPMCQRGLANHLRALGIPLRLARIAAVRELVLDVPAPVVAHALGFHHTTTHRQNTHAAGTWNRYVAVRG